MSACGTYAAMNRILATNVDLRRLKVFLEALDQGDAILVENAIAETRDPWAQELMDKMRKEHFLLDDDDDDEIDLT